MTDVTPADDVPAPDGAPVAAAPAPATKEAASRGWHGRVPASPRRRGTWLPSWEMVTTKQLELRKRRGLMVVVVLLTIGLPFLVLGLRLLFHAVAPKSYGPAGSPTVFQDLIGPMAELGFVVAATLGATAGTTDLTDGLFRHLVITGRSRLSLYFARIPAGCSILVPLVGVAFASLCLVTAYAGTPQPTSVNENGVAIPLHLDQAQLETWLLDHPTETAQMGPGAAIAVPLGPGGPVSVLPRNPAAVRQQVERNIGAIYQSYASDEIAGSNPPVDQMVKIGLWLELEIVIGFLVGLGLGSLTGQRTVATILMIILEIILTPILSNAVIPHLLNAQRLVVGVAMGQLRPSGLASPIQGGHGPRIFGGRGLGIPLMPTWAMIAVIVGWIVGWTVLGAWRMATRDA